MNHDDTPAAPAWQPLLVGDEAASAWRAIDEIADALASWPEDLELSANLGSGAAGLALFYAYLAEAAGDERYADVAFSYLDQMIESVSRIHMLPSLYSGFTGAAWTLEHLAGRLVESDDGDSAVSHEIDDMLLALLRGGTWPGDYDLINGLAGFGVYALEALPRAAGWECLGLLLDQLERLADEQPEGLSWHTRPELLPDHQRRLFPAGYHNLGLAHGMPAVAAFLAALCAAEIEPARARRLLEPAVAWLLAHRLTPDARTCFPQVKAEGIEPQPSRLAWCYGDPGVAAALLLAAQLTGESGWEREALRVAVDAATRPTEESGIVDACLCHGSAGLGHLFNRFHQATGDEALAGPARAWFRRALVMRRPGEGIAGYLAYNPLKAQETRWTAERGFLEGAAGIGLALLAAVSAVDPAWDRVLMTSIRPLNGHRAPRAEVER